MAAAKQNKNAKKKYMTLKTKSWATKHVQSTSKQGRQNVILCEKITIKFNEAEIRQMRLVVVYIGWYVGCGIHLQPTWLGFFFIFLRLDFHSNFVCFFISFGWLVATSRRHHKLLPLWPFLLAAKLHKLHHLLSKRKKKIPRVFGKLRFYNPNPITATIISYEMLVVFFIYL